MEDGERLNLLKEIGGSKVYEDRRTESLKILQDAEGRKRQIAELVSLLESPWEQFDGKSLKVFQQGGRVSTLTKQEGRQGSQVVSFSGVVLV